MDYCTYHYPDINGHDQFRLVTLQPGQTQDDIVCDLHIIQFEEAPIYETLSYAWGDQSDTKSIYLGGSVMKIPSNLEAALRQLRHASSPRILWADFLCIDQGNDLEKAQQVAMMGRIYQSCSGVLVWLGVPSSRPLGRRRDKLLRRAPPRSSLNPYSIVYHFVDGHHVHELSCFKHSRFTANGLKFTRDAIFIAQWKALMECVRSSWWTRFWCIQETLLPPKVTVVFGKWQIDWEAIQIAAMAHRRHWIDCCAPAAAQIPDKYIIFYDLLVLEPQQSQPEISHGSQASRPRELRTAYKDLDWVLRVYRHRDCKDPRDKVYGILGLIDQTQHPTVVPDYSLDVSRVYITAMTSVIVFSTFDLECLTGSGFNSSGHKGTLPSWVRDFSIKLDMTSMAYEKMRMRAYPLYKADDGLPTEPAQIRDGKTLHLKGLHVDVIAKRGNALQHWDWKHIRHVLRQWYRIAGKGYPHRGATLRRDSVETMYWRTVTADVISGPSLNWQRLTDTDMTSYVRWVRTTFTAKSFFFHPSLHSTYIEAITTAIYGRSFFVTRHGNFGLCFPNVQPGDEIWIVSGLRVPLILRYDHDAYRLIGECYLDGLMYGMTPVSQVEDIVIR